MSIKQKPEFSRIKQKILSSTFFTLTVVVTTQAQDGNVSAGGDLTWLYVALGGLGIVTAGFFLTRRGKSSPTALTVESSNKNETDALDGEKELEWLRKHQKLVGKKNLPKAAPKNTMTEKTPQTAPTAGRKIGNKTTKSPETASSRNEPNALPMPIFSFNRLEFARPFDALPVSDDGDLLSAIEQSQDELEEDEEVRDLSIRVLAAFRKRNAVEALSQIALYDLSSNLRSKAVTVLSEFDHESVFETILLANADPTREVRAAAARGLTKLTFDRADAWTRIVETGEEGRAAQAARAAIESGFVDMSFDRLIHPDRRYAYEAFALMALLIKAGETEKIFRALETHRDMNVRRAILHVIKATREQKTLSDLYLLLEKDDLPGELREEVDKTIEELALVAV